MTKARIFGVALTLPATVKGFAASQFGDPDAARIGAAGGLAR